MAVASKCASLRAVFFLVSGLCLILTFCIASDVLGWANEVKKCFCFHFVWLKVKLLINSTDRMERIRYKVCILVMDGIMFEYFMCYKFIMILNDIFI